jgi:protein involved in polysaccharide export with SLBB domain
MAGYTLAEVLTNILTALQDILYYVSTAIADNASVIATVVVIGAIAFLVMRYGSRVFRGITSWIRGLF